MGQANRETDSHQPIDEEWLSAATCTFIDEIHSLGLAIPNEAVQDLLVEEVRRVAGALGIPEGAACILYDETLVRTMARTAAEPFEKESITADLIDLPSTHRIPVDLAADTITGLALAAELELQILPTHTQQTQNIVESLVLIASWALLIESHYVANSATKREPDAALIPIPSAAVHRALRKLTTGQFLLEHDGLAGDADDTECFASALCATITALRLSLDTSRIHG